MAQSNIYAQKENGDLRLIAEVDGESDPALAVDALLDEMPKLRQRSFIVIDVDNVMTVEAGDEIVNPRRQITVTGGSNSTGATVSEPETDDEDEADEEDEENGEDEQPEAEEEEEAPKPKRRRRTAAKPAAKRKPRKSSGSGRKSPFKANPASVE